MEAVQRVLGYDPAPCPGPACPAVPEANYQGCFNDHANGGTCDLPHLVTGHCAGQKGPSLPPLPDISLERCNAECAPLGFKFFGVQMGGSGCFCGNAFGSQGRAASDGLCNKPCAGNPSEVCGGPNLNSVYKTVSVSVSVFTGGM